MKPLTRSKTGKAYLFMLQLLFFWGLQVTGAPGFPAEENSPPPADTTHINALVQKAKSLAPELPDSALYFYNKAKVLYKKAGLPEESAKVTLAIANIEHARHNPHKALQLLLADLTVHEKAGNEKAIAHLCKSIGYIYITLQHIEGPAEFGVERKAELMKEAQYYYGRALSLFTKHNNKAGQADVNSRLGDIHLDLEEPELALPYYEQALQYFQHKNDEEQIVNLYINLSHLKLSLGQQKEGFELAEKALSYYRKTNNKSQQGFIQNNLGAHYTIHEDQTRALPYYLRAFDLAKQSNDLHLLHSVTGNLYWAYKDLGQPAKALEFYEQYSEIEDSVFNLSRGAEIAELQEKYEAEKKQRQIENLRKDKALNEAFISRRTWERNVTIAGLLVTLLIAFLIIRNARQKQKSAILLGAKNEELNRNRIQELLRDQELASIHGVLQGQETERKRIAQDLHDRLGSLLATVKLHFQMAKTETERDNACALIDEACQEVRQIAHNMVSGVLMKFGLVAALNDLARAINSTGKVHMQTMAHGLNSRLPGNSEVEIYRIVQELVSNALKHSDATEITVQLHKRDTVLNLIVEDDGKGFLPAEAKAKGGLGLKGIQSRVRQLNGELSIDSSPGRGATILIEIPVDVSDPLSHTTTHLKEENHDQIIAG